MTKPVPSTERNRQLRRRKALEVELLKSASHKDVIQDIKDLGFDPYASDPDNPESFTAFVEEAAEFMTKHRVVLNLLDPPFVNATT